MPTLVCDNYRVEHMEKHNRHIDELKLRVPDVKDRIFSSIEGAGIDGWSRH